MRVKDSPKEEKSSGLDRISRADNLSEPDTSWLVEYDEWLSALQAQYYENQIELGEYGYDRPIPVR